LPYSSALKGLAQIRKMGPAVQINIAEQQNNTASWEDSNDLFSCALAKTLGVS
jgi:hypothetical protein